MPLGGSRPGPTTRLLAAPVNGIRRLFGIKEQIDQQKLAAAWGTPVNLMLTMVLGGLWHGANWSFAIWGALHGTYLVIHRAWLRTSLRRWIQKSPVRQFVWQACSLVLTFHAVVAAWAFFRIPQWSMALNCLWQCIEFAPDRMFVGATANPSLWILLSGWMALGLAMHWQGTLGKWIDALPTPRTLRGSGIAELSRGAVVGFWLTLVPLSWLMAPGGDAPPFIYFQF